MGRLAQLWAFLLVGLASQAWSQHAQAHDAERARELRSDGEILSLGEILQRLGIAKRALLDVELEEEGERRVYEIEFIGRDRRIHQMEIDARTGQPVDREGD